MVNKDSEVLLNLLVDAFRLPIRLWVVCCRDVCSHSHEFVQVLHELGHELWSSVTNDLFRQPMFAPHVIPEQPGCSVCRQVHIRRYGNNHL